MTGDPRIRALGNFARTLGGVPLGFEVRPVPALSAANLRSDPVQAIYRPYLFLVDEETAPHFVVDALHLGGSPQFVSNMSAVPARMFTIRQLVERRIDMDTMQVGLYAAISVRNLHESQSFPFFAVLIGHTLRFGE
jgi:hypothetical protein